MENVWCLVTGLSYEREREMRTGRGGSGGGLFLALPALLVNAVLHARVEDNAIVPELLAGLDALINEWVIRI